MTAMLEKAARAAAEACEEDWHAAQRVGVTDGYFKIARAVLMAVRDASPEMVDKMYLREPLVGSEYADDVYPVVWSAGIDAILAQEPGA